MTWLGKKWEDVLKDLIEKKIAHESKITYPSGKMTVCGDLRVARVSQVEGKLKFVLLHDRFNR